MVNNIMANDDKLAQPEQSSPVPGKPTEAGVLNIDEHVRIFDPNSKEMILEQRA